MIEDITEMVKKYPFILSFGETLLMILSTGRAIPRGRGII